MFMGNHRKYLTKDEQNQIIEDLKRGASINEIRNNTGYGVNILKRILIESSLPYDVSSHKLRTGQSWINYKEVFIENSKHYNSLVNRIIRDHNIIPHDRCWMCGLSEWINGKLTLELDHINGIGNDNRVENLRFLCPNCHSQTDTFRGRNINNGRVKVSDEVLIDAIKSTENLHQALIKVGLSPKSGNYSRAQKLKVALT